MSGIQTSRPAPVCFGTGEGPLFSILTVVRNASQALPRTLASVANQTFRGCEHLVIDGGSTDGTADWIRQHSAELAYWVSEPDLGISDAFNKAVAAAKGRLILFLGAGDCLVHTRVLEEVAGRLPDFGAPYFFYGDVEYAYRRRIRTVRRNYTFRRFCRYSCIPHQAMFLDRWFFAHYGLFDLNFKRTMDYEHTARFIREHPPQYLPLTIARMPRDGVSTNPMPTHDEMDRVRRRHRLATEPEIRWSRCILHMKLLVQRHLIGGAW